MSLKLQQKPTKTNETKRANDLINSWYHYGIILWGRQNAALPRAAKCLEPGLSMHINAWRLWRYQRVSYALYSNSYCCKTVSSYTPNTSTYDTWALLETHDCRRTANRLSNVNCKNGADRRTLQDRRWLKRKLMPPLSIREWYNELHISGVCLRIRM